MDDRNESTQTESTQKQQQYSINGISLNQALDNAVYDINNKIIQNSVMALVNFTSTSDKLSDYIIDELMNRIINNTNIKIVERKQIETVQEELNFQMSGLVSDETAKSIGKFIGADVILTGNLISIANGYRIGIKTIHVETGVVQSLYIINIENNAEMISLIRNYTNIELNASNTPYSFLKISDTHSFGLEKRIHDGSGAIISPDNKWIIAVSGYDGKIYIYDIMDLSLLRAIPIPKIDYFPSLSISNDGRIIAVGYETGYDYEKNTDIGRILWYDILTGRKIGDDKFYGGRSHKCLCVFNPVYTTQLLIAFGNRIYIFDTFTRKNKSIKLNTRIINTIEYSNDDSYIAVGDTSGNITILDGLSLKILKRFSGHSGGINSLSFSPDNSVLISGSSDFTIGVWNIANGNEIITLTNHVERIESVLYTINGLYFLSSSADGTTKLWDSHSFKVLKEYRNSEGINLSHDGNYFINDFGVLFKIE
ncbi:MAG: hypothetical protein LBJ35_07010 [Spirochaetaceae bacterium]|nr:hypothetical protein [Spirochaetaceae bacterium]